MFTDIDYRGLKRYQPLSCRVKCEDKKKDDYQIIPSVDGIIIYLFNILSCSGLLKKSFDNDELNLTLERRYSSNIFPLLR